MQFTKVTLCLTHKNGLCILESLRGKCLRCGSKTGYSFSCQCTKLHRNTLTRSWAMSETSKPSPKHRKHRTAAPTASVPKQTNLKEFWSRTFPTLHRSHNICWSPPFWAFSIGRFPAKQHKTITNWRNRLCFGCETVCRRRVRSRWMRIDLWNKRWISTISPLYHTINLPWWKEIVSRL